MKPKEECIEAIKTINLTLLKLKSPNGATRKAQGDKFANSLIEQLENNKKYYIKQLEKYT